MNKFYKILIFGIFFVISGFVYGKYYRPPGVGPVKASGRVVEIQMRTVENAWTWDPAEMRVKAGDLVKITIINEDSYDHGLAIEAFGVNRRLFAKKETVIEFLASRTGSFNFYCSVTCGEGHHNQMGILFVEENSE